MNTNNQQTAWYAIARHVGRQRAVLCAVTAKAVAAKRRKLRAIQAVASFALNRKTKKGPPRFRALAYSGGELQVGNYDLPIVVDLTGLTVDKRGVCVNLGHIDDQRVGHVDRVQNTGRRLILSGVISGATDAATEFLTSFANQYPWCASVEIGPTAPPEMIPEGAVVEVNSQHFAGPVYVARESRLTGLAFVSRGADDSTEIEVAARAVA